MLIITIWSPTCARWKALTTSLRRHSDLGVALFHIYGLVVVLNMGLSRALPSSRYPFELETFLKLVQDHGVTLAHLVRDSGCVSKSPVVKFDLSKLQTIFCGAAPLDEHLTRA